jgi:flagellar FliJ protein
MRFRFRLASVRDHRRRIEDARALALGEACRERDVAVARFNAMQARTQACREAVTVALAGGAAAATLHLLVRTVEISAQQARSAADAVAAAEATVERSRGELVEAARDRQVLDRAHERAHARFVHEAERLEQKGVDDVASVYQRWRESVESPAEAKK